MAISASRLTSKKILLPLLLIILILAIVVGAYVYMRVNSSKSENNTTKVDEKVRKLIELPAGKPDIVTSVTHIERLKNDKFLERAQNGDVVLLYESFGKAILYRPSTNKLIEVAVYDPALAVQNAPTPSIIASNVQVVILNGTKTAGVAKKEQVALENKYKNMEVTKTGNSSGDYTKDLIVDLSGGNAVFAKTLATDLNGEVGSLPSTETKPDNADILIILGSAE